MNNYHFNKNTISNNLLNLNKYLQSKIFGQDHAIKIVVNKLKVSYAGLSNKNKPLGSFLFTGPTGVGKTEFAIELAKNLNLHFERIDMSEFSSKQDVKNLVGGSAGLVGYEDGGMLTNTIIDNPTCVLLLDEIEKAHPRVLNILLQVLDYGVLTSTKGEKAYFNDVIIIMTSNLGANTKATVGFGSNNITNKIDEINKHLRPEFRARLNAMIEFNPLNDEMINNIVNKFINNLSNKLNYKNIKLEVSSKVLDTLNRIAKDTQQGARGIDQIIEKELILKLSHEILFGDLRNGGEVYVNINDNEEYSFLIQNNSNVKNTNNSGEKVFLNCEDAQDYAKSNPGVTITRSTCGKGYIIKDNNIDFICPF